MPCRASTHAPGMQQRRRIEAAAVGDCEMEVAERLVAAQRLAAQQRLCDSEAARANATRTMSSNRCCRLTLLPASFL